VANHEFESAAAEDILRQQLIASGAPTGTHSAGAPPGTHSAGAPLDTGGGEGGGGEGGGGEGGGGDGGGGVGGGGDGGGGEGGGTGPAFPNTAGGVTRVPYACNRAVIFISDQYHESEPFEFLPGCAFI